MVEEGDDVIPEGRLDLTSPDVVTFYHTETSVFSNLYPAAVSVEGVEFPTVRPALCSCDCFVQPTTVFLYDRAAGLFSAAE